MVHNYEHNSECMHVMQNTLLNNTKPNNIASSDILIKVILKTGKGLLGGLQLS